MLILAFDTSGFAGSVALLEGATPLVQRTLDPQRRSAQTLAPALVEVLSEAGRQATHVRLVATTVGPGSFTGLRVGVTAAKTFTYAVGADVIGLSTLEVIAHQVPAELLTGGDVQIEAVLDAQRKDLFVGRFGVKAPAAGDGLPEMRRLEDDRLMSGEAWLAGLAPGTIVSGGGLRTFRERLPAEVVVAGEEHWEPLAVTVGRLAWREHQRGRRDDLWRLAPRYLRQSAAEEKAAAATRSNQP